MSQKPADTTKSYGNGIRVLEHLYQKPILAVSEVQKLTKTTFTAANQLVSRLVKLGFVSEMTGQKRNRRFRYEPYIQLFSEPTREAVSDSVVNEPNP